jgi:CoA:oxalate CoA-transferase
MERTHSSAAARGPLAGRRLIEVGHMLMGPYCGMLLADLGMEVIKIEAPAGDIARTVSPHSIDGHNAYFVSLNRNKQSVVLDLASEPGRRELHALVRTADGLITNLRPSAIKSLGLTYEALKDVNPRIVCVAMTGFGLEGEYSERPAYDYVIQAMTGVMDLTGDPDGAPTKAGYSAVDNSAGILGAVGLLARIIEGRGGQVDIAMYDAMLSQLNYLAGAWLNAGEKPQRQARSAHPYIVPAQIFRTADGWLTLFVSHDGFWRIFCEKVGRPEWVADSRFATMKARSANREALLPLIEALLATQTSQHWEDLLAPHGIVVAQVAPLDAALASANAAARGMVVTLEDAEGKFRAVGNPIKCSGHETPYRMAPRLGEHNDTCLKQS